MQPGTRCRYFRKCSDRIPEAVSRKREREERNQPKPELSQQLEMEEPIEDGQSVAEEPSQSVFIQVFQSAFDKIANRTQIGMY